MRSFIWATEDILQNETLRGGNYTQLMHIADWYPTVVSGIAGIEIPKLNYTLDGVNQWKGLIGTEKDDIYSEPYFYYRDFIYYDHNIDNQVPGPYSAYRKRWNKVINGTGGDASESGWNPPPMGMDYNYDYKMITNMSNDMNDVGGVPLLLYNISLDPYEKNEISNQSKNNQELVQQLYQEMLTIFESAPNGFYPNPPEDESCPPLVHPNDSVVGPYWVPWCGM